jgi:hypothetical protein
MKHGHGPHVARAARVTVALLALAGLALFNSSCSKDSDDDDDDNDPTKTGMCFPDSDGLTGGAYTINVEVTDTGFVKNLIASQNDSMVTLTLKNSGTKPHGFAVGCVSVLTSYPNLPAKCPPLSCFPGASAPGSTVDAGAGDGGTSDGGTSDGGAAVQMPAAIAPIAPGTSQTIKFFTPTPDGLIYPFTSNNPDDSAVSALNNGQWSLM